MSDDEPDVSTGVSTDGQPETEGTGECFVIAPIGADGSPTRERTEDLFRHAIRPVVNDFGLEAKIAHKISEPGDIPKQVIQFLFDAELVIADLTDHNANVMYELAIRHATGEPVVKIAEEGHTPPFDIWSQRTKFYRAGFGGAEEFREKLRPAIRDALDPDHSPDNPIQRARKGFTLHKVMEGKIRELAGEEGDELAKVLQHLVDRIDNLESGIALRNRRAPVRVGSTESSQSVSRPIPIDVDDLSDKELETIMTRVEDAHALHDRHFESDVREEPSGDTNHLTLLVPEKTVEDTEKIVRQTVGDSRYEMM